MSAPIDPSQVDVEIDVGPIHLKNPLMTASGCFAYGQQFAGFMDLRELGGLSTKGISPAPRSTYFPPSRVRMPNPSGPACRAWTT